MKKLLLVIAMLLLTSNIFGQWIAYPYAPIGTQNTYSLCKTSEYIFISPGGYGIWKYKQNTGETSYIHHTGYVMSVGEKIIVRTISTSRDTLKMSTNYGSNWTIINGGVLYLVYNKQLTGDLVATENYLFTAYDDENKDSGIVRSAKNFGYENWTKKKIMNKKLSVHNLHNIGEKIFASTQYGLFRSTNYGDSWDSCNYGLPPITTNWWYVRSMTSSADGIYASLYDTAKKIYKSTDGGLTWNGITYDFPGKIIGISIFNGDNMFAGTDEGQIRRTTNEGLNWILDYSSSNRIIGKFIEGNEYIFAGTSKGLLYTWRSTLTSTEPPNTVPADYSLSQNYPNPFNPTTNINFAIPKSGLVTMKVFDILGKEVATLVNGNFNAGSYTVDFNASSYASGVYFYRLDVNGFTEVKRMMLVK